MDLSWVEVAIAYTVAVGSLLAGLVVWWQQPDLTYMGLFQKFFPLYAGAIMGVAMLALAAFEGDR